VRTFRFKERNGLLDLARVFQQLRDDSITTNLA
jgi:hypothetical protein